MSRFDWKTEGDAGWSEQEWLPPAESAPSKGRRRWLLPALLLLVAAFFLAWQLMWRIDLATNRARDELLAGHNVLRTAASQNDTDLLGVISTAPSAIPGGTHLYNREFLGLTHQGRSDRSVQPEIVLDPDMLSAELISTIPYQTITPDGQSRLIILEQISYYRREQDRWWLSPLDREYWGETERESHQRLQLIYPERDKEVTRRLGRDLEALLDDMCRRLPATECPADFAMEIVMSTDPESLDMPDQVETVYRRGSWVVRHTLPTISLVGRPSDEAAYQALYRGYGRYVLGAAAAHLYRDSCCPRPSPFQVLIFQQLVDLRAADFGLSAGQKLVDAEQWLLVSWRLAELDTLWSQITYDELSITDGHEARLLLTFLLETMPQVQPDTMMETLLNQTTFSGWLDALYGELLSLHSVELMAELDARWLAFLSVQLSQEQTAPPLPLPQQELVVTCFDQTGSVSSRQWHYRPDLDQWNPPQSFDELLYGTIPLPGRSTTLLSVSLERRTMDIFLQDASRIPLQEDGFTGFSTGQTDPTGTYLVAFLADEETWQNRIILHDIDACLAGQCQPIELPGWPIWSPDGQHLLLANYDQGSMDYLAARDGALLLGPGQPAQLVRANAPLPPPVGSDELVSLPSGQMPFWLDNTHYGYVRSQRSAPDELVVASIEDDVPQVLVTLQTVASFVSPNPLDSDLHFRYAAAVPGQPNQLLLVASSADSSLYLLLLDTTAPQQLKLILTRPLRQSHMISFSPDGRWLQLVSTPDAGGTPAFPALGRLELLHLTSGQHISYPAASPGFPVGPVYGWSGDGQWLSLMAGPHMLALAVPEKGYVRYTGINDSLCPTLYWQTD